MDDDDLPLNEPTSVKPKAPDGLNAFHLGVSRSGVEMEEEENAAIAGEDVTVLLQFPNKEVSVQVSAPLPCSFGVSPRPRSRPAHRAPRPTPRRCRCCADEDGTHCRAAQAEGARGPR